MGKKISGRRIDTIFVLVVFCAFAASVLMVLMLGGSVYRNITEESQEGYEQRTCLSYIWTKVKNGDSAGSIYVGDYHGLSALCLEKDYGGVIYQTVIYHYEGWVREILYESGLEFYPEDGQQVIEAESLSFEALENGMIKAVCSDGGKEMSLFISPRAQTGIELF